MAGSSTKQAGTPRWSALQRWTLGVTSMAAFMAGMDALVVTTALPTIHADLGAGMLPAVRQAAARRKGQSSSPDVPPDGRTAANLSAARSSCDRMC
jgi:hypothetical protein